MKIEEVLAAYLPYELKILVTTKGPFLSDPEKKSQELLTSRNLSSFTGKKPYRCLSQKLIIRPLSDFSGNKIGKDVMVELECDLETVHELWYLHDGSQTLDKTTVKTYMVMCKNHIDFDGLIKKGLAIDINTLN